MKKLKVGIAGFGVVGNRRKEYIDAHKQLELVAVCDQKYNQEGVFENGVKFFTNFKDLLECSLDVVFVCMSNDMAAEVTIAALKKQIHVFCEKPPARHIEELTSVINCEKDNPTLKLMYGFNHRYHDSVKQALEITNSEELGKVINIRGVYGKAKLITFNQTDWRTKREISGGGVLLDQGIHMIDLILLFGGSFKEVHSFISNSHWKYNVEDNAYAIMRSDEDVVAMLHSSATQWRHKFELEINLQKGSLILKGILSGTKSYGSETLTVVYADPDNDSGDPKEQVFHYNNDPSWKEEIDLFTDSVLKNKKITSGNSNEALEAMRLLYRIYYDDPLWRKAYKISNPD